MQIPFKNFIFKRRLKHKILKKKDKRNLHTLSCPNEMDISKVAMNERLIALKSVTDSCLE
jgi:hypothetical protein